MGSPCCWLAAERVGGAPVWRPVHAATLGAPVAADRDDVARAARAQGLPEPRWPERWPFDSRHAMLAATFAAGTGRAVAFSLAAMRQAFAAGRDLSVEDNILIAAAACELHPRAVLTALASRTAAAQLDAATREAADAGVSELPALLFPDGSVHAGHDAAP